MTQAEALKVLQSGANVFLTGEAGAGKSYLINEFVRWAKDNRMSVAIGASTGIAAMQLEGGRTVHSLCGLGTDADDELFNPEKIWEIAKKPWTQKELSADVIIIDEISMLSSMALTNACNVIKMARGGVLSDGIWGGAQIVLVGDFFQLPPVQVDDAKPRHFAFTCDTWKNSNFEVCYLTEQHRQNDLKYNAVLNHLRSGTFSKADLKYLQTAQNSDDHDLESTKLYPSNRAVNEWNEAELAKLKGATKVYEMQDVVMDPKLHPNSAKFIFDFMHKKCLSPQTLVLKVGSLVMFTKNHYTHPDKQDFDDYRSGKIIWANGTLGKVVDFSDNLPVVETKKGTHVVGRFEWEYKQNGRAVAAVVQIPLRLAWAITIHKSQGMTLDKLTVDLTRTFAPGMEYVALSRVRSLDSLNLIGMGGPPEMHPLVVEKDKEFRKLSDLTEEKYGV